MALRIGSIVIHCHHFDRLSRNITQRVLPEVHHPPASDGWCVLRDPRGTHPNVSFQARETGRPGRNWIHPDLYTDNQTMGVERLEARSRYPWRYRVGADFVVLEDPDGNPFCVVQQREHGSQAASDQ